MTDQSIFLDIGSGFGYPNFLATGMTGCRGVGVEVSEVRAYRSIALVDEVSAKKEFNMISWKKLMDFRCQDACLPRGPFTSRSGDHCTHVFAYNWAQ